MKSKDIDMNELSINVFFCLWTGNYLGLMSRKMFEYEPKIGGIQVCLELIAYPCLFRSGYASKKS